LLVKGANQMMGYLGQPERTAEVSIDGWYVTGDIAAVDDEGFVRITDRLSRFSKIGGEMVPHLKVEEAVYAIVGESSCAVTGVPTINAANGWPSFIRVRICSRTIMAPLSETDLPSSGFPSARTSTR